MRISPITSLVRNGSALTVKRQLIAEDQRSVELAKTAVKRLVLMDNTAIKLPNPVANELPVCHTKYTQF